MMTRLVPKVFFDHMSGGLDLFVNGLGFKVLHQDASLAVVARDEAKAYVVESSEYAAIDRPEIAIETDTIGEFHKEISSKRPDLLHPNSKLDEEAMGCTGVCRSGQDWRLRGLPSVVAVHNKAMQATCETHAPDGWR